MCTCTHYPKQTYTYSTLSLYALATASHRFSGGSSRETTTVSTVVLHGQRRESTSSAVEIRLKVYKI